MNENRQFFLEMALNTGRTLQSEETGFIHYFKGKDQPPFQAIPIYENLLFCLALFKTKTVESINEGKKILDKLLAYQNSEGLFPTYTHEFPNCFDQWIGIYLLPIFFVMEKQFGSIIGPKIKKARDLLLEVTQKEYEKMPLHKQVRALASLKAYGIEVSFFNWDEWLRSESSRNPSHLGDLCLAISLLESQQRPLWWNEAADWLVNHWNSSLLCYEGFYENVEFNAGQPEITLFDLFLCYSQDLLSPRMKKGHPLLLQGALLSEKLFNPIVPKKSWFISIDEKQKVPFIFCWGNHHVVKNLQLYLTSQKLVKVNHGEKIIFEIESNEEILGDDKEKSKEVIFYLTLTEDIKILVNQKPATTFRLGDEITIEDSQTLLKCRFLSEEGKFQGHLSRGNRPSEKQKKYYKAYDWILALRTIERPTQHKLNLQIEYVVKA